MAHPFDQIVSKDHWVLERTEALNEVVFRSPAALSAFNCLSHLCFTRETVEDFLFYRVCAGLREDLQRQSFLVSPLDADEHPEATSQDHRKINIIGNGGLLTFSHKWQNLYKIVHQPLPAKIASLNGVAANIDEIFEQLLDTNPEYFIFGCFNQLATIITNRLFETRPHLRDASADCESMVRCFQSLIESYSYTIRDIIANRIIEANQNLHAYQPNLGGIITDLKDKARNAPGVDTFENDFLDLDFTQSPQDLSQNTYRLRWHRLTYYWTYTFYEAAKFIPMSPPPITEDEEQFHLPLFGQSTKVKTDYAKCLGRFSALLFSFGHAPSVLDSPTLRRLHQDVKGSFPGKLLAGAHYLFVPFGIMLAALYLPSLLIREAYEYLPMVRPLGEGMEAEAWREIVAQKFITAAAVARKAPEYQELLRLIEIIECDAESGTGEHGILKLMKEEAPPPLTEQQKLTFLDLGGVFSQWLSDNPERQALAFRVLGKLCTDFWLFVMQNSPELSGKSTTDLISCFVVDGQAVYVSNFQAEGEDQFTKTIFVDLCLSGYQRARLAQRLCDISTQRNLCVRDLNRVRCIWQGMDEITGELNKLAEQAAVFYSEEGVTKCKNLISRLEAIQQQFDQMNSFVVYGIRGKFLATQASLVQIRERIADIRQSRIRNVPMIGEFIERRVADAVRDVVYMSERYDYLRERIQDAYNRVRTQLNSVQTENMVSFSETTSKFVREVSATLEITRELQDSMLDRARAQVDLQKDMKDIEQQLSRSVSQQIGIQRQLSQSVAQQTGIQRQLNESISRQARLGVIADMFAVLAGTYYGSHLLEEIWEGAKMVTWPLRLLELTVIALMLGFVIGLTRHFIKAEPEFYANPIVSGLAEGEEEDG